MQFDRTRPRRRSMLSLTPLIDVVFILLLFFMLATTYERWQTIRFELGIATESAVASADVTARVVLRAEGISFEQQPVSLAGLIARLQTRMRQTPKLVVTIQPTAQVSVQQLVDLIDQLKRAGIDQAVLAGEPGIKP